VAQRLNPPPGWPEPPRWWTPPPGWTPDPSWPDPPPGWPLWVDEETPLPSRPPAGDVPARVLGRAALALAAAWVVVELVGGRPWSAVVVAALALGALGVAGLALGRVRWARLRGRAAAGVLLVAAVGLLVAGQPLREDGGAASTDVVRDDPGTPAPTPTPVEVAGETPTPSPAVPPPTSSSSPG
jgi:hypothetical protein